jgi:hypothetical protein
VKGKAFQHKWRRENPGQSKSDWDGKYIIKEVLSEHFGLSGVTDKVIFVPAIYDTVCGKDTCIQLERKRYPDVFVEPNLAFEADGEYHDISTEMPLKFDIEKRLDYDRVGIRYYIVNKYVTNGYQKDLVRQVLEDQGLCPVKDSRV